MESEISGLYEPLGGKLGCNQSHVQVLGDRPEGALYHQCHREPEQRLPPSQPQPQRLPEWYEPAEGPISGYLWTDEKVDDAGEKLGCSLRRAGDHVPRKAVRHVSTGRFNRRPLWQNIGKNAILIPPTVTELRNLWNKRIPSPIQFSIFPDNLPRPSRRKRRGLRWRWTIRIRRQRPPAPESWNLWLRHRSRVYRIFWTEPEGGHKNEQ